MQNYVNQINLEDSHEESHKIGKEEGKKNALSETVKRLLNLDINVKDISKGNC